jgi:hypothetical protein
MNDSSKLSLINTRKLILPFMGRPKIDNKKMAQLADHVKSHIPGCGFAIIAFDIEDGTSQGNYISNVSDEFMIKTLECQLALLKQKSK